jgi:chromosomal replication initiator protein
VYRSIAGHPPGGEVHQSGDSEALQARGRPFVVVASSDRFAPVAIHTCGLHCGRLQVRRAEIQVNDAIDLWRRCTETLRRQAPAAWQTSLASLSPSRIDHDALVLSVPGTVLREHIASRYLGLISEVASQAAEQPLQVRLEVTPVENVVEQESLLSDGPAEDGADDQAVSRKRHSHAGSQARLARSHQPEQETRTVIGIDPRDTFDAFVIGSSNRFAHAAALSVAEDPGDHYNPLFIHGEAGLGKTHLLHAIGNYVCTNLPKHRVKYVTTEAFLNEFVYAIRTNSTMEFKRRYREECDVLLIDDVQFMAGKEQLQEEFFHTFNQLFGAARQIVITSDRPPKNIATLEDRLRSRFASGLTTDIQPPELETRLAILIKRAEDESIPVEHEVLELIATHVKDNIRELEGALTRVAAYGNLYGEKVSREMAERVLSDIVGSSTPRRITVDEIMSVTAETFGVTIEDLIGPSRRRPLVNARQISMYVVRELIPETSFPTIAREFGNRDHTTVMHAVKKVKGLMDKRLTVYEQTTDLMRRIRAGE